MEKSQQIEFYCRNCKKSLKMSYTLSGNVDMPVMAGITMRCHTHKCVRVMEMRHYTEGRLVSMADRFYKVYL